MKTHSNIQPDHDIVGYVDGNAIILDENGCWYFITIPEQFVSPGEVFLQCDLTPLSALPTLKQQAIFDALEGR